MSTPGSWLVASADTVLRWGVALDRAGLDYHPLAFSQIEDVGTAPEWRARVEAVRPARVLLTSVNAARVLPDGFGAGLEAACVGETTAAEARRKGFEVVLVGASTGTDLARALGGGEGGGTLLMLRGREVRPETLEILRAAGWVVEEEVVYEARSRPTFPAEVAHAPEPTGIGVGSPRAAAGLAAALAETGREALRATPAVAIGPTTATRLEEVGFTRVRAPAVPGVEGLVEELKRCLTGDGPSR